MDADRFAAGVRRLLRMVWRNGAHPKAREERIKAGAAALNGMGVALMLSAGAGPLLNPAQEPSAIVRICLFAAGVACVVAAQVLLGYIAPEEIGDD